MQTLRSSRAIRLSGLTLGAAALAATGLLAGQPQPRAGRQRRGQYGGRPVVRGQSCRVRRRPPG